MRKDQEPASINVYLRQKRQVAKAEAARDVLTEQDDTLDAPIQQDVGSLDVPFRAVERVAFGTLSVVVRVQVLPATRDQLVVTHSGESRDLPAVRAGQWFARVAAPRRRLANQPNLVSLDLLLFHDVYGSLALRAHVRPIGVFPDARPRLKIVREGNTPSKLHLVLR